MIDDRRGRREKTDILSFAMELQFATNRSCHGFVTKDEKVNG
jgi:hypothetical protein